MSAFFKSPFYFLFCASFGFLAWSLSFQSELNDPKYLTKNVLNEAQYSSNSMPQVDDDGTAITFDEFGNALPNAAVVAELNQIKDSDLLRELQLSEQDLQKKSEEPYVTNPSDVDLYEKIMSQSYGEKKDLQNFMQIAAVAPDINYDDEKACGLQKRLTVDANLKKSPLVAELIKDKVDDPSIPKKCIIHVMKQFQLPDSTRGSCPKGVKAQPVRGAPKPCISKALVNATYNSFVDITSCLGVNPKSLLPKLSNESGMLINTLGMGLDAGVGQLTISAIEEVNNHYSSFIQEVEANAATKPACARMLKYKSLLAQTGSGSYERCGLIAAPENPVKNIFYMAMLNRLNTATAVRRFENNDIQGKLAKLGLADANMNALIEAISLASYNAGPAVPFNSLNEYLDKRIKFGKKISVADFDFHNPKTAKDIDGTDKLVTTIARSFVNSPFIKIDDPNLQIKLKKVKLLPEKIRSAYLLTFPEFLIYNQNNFDENQKVITKDYKTLGAPGYLGFLADKNRALRESFSETSEGADYCSNPNFLKIK